MKGFAKTLKILNKIFFILCIIAFFIGLGLSMLEKKPNILSTNNTSSKNNYNENGSYIPSHTHNYILSQVVNPTCTTKGYTIHTCATCNNSYKDNYTNALGHNYVKSGSTYICTRCNDNKTEYEMHLKEFKVGETCPCCNRTVYANENDYILMNDKENHLLAEFHGTTTYTFDSSIKQRITDVYLADSVTSIGNNAFYGCFSLTNITIPNSVKSIGYCAFCECSGLTSIIIPDSVKSIGYCAFSGCSGLTCITIPNSVKSIGESAFFCCSGLTSIIIPDSVKSIGEGAFAYCNGLTSITFNGTTAQWYAISKDTDWKYKVPSSCKVHCTDGDLNI